MSTNTHASTRSSLLNRLLLGAGSAEPLAQLEARALLSVNIVDDISDITVDRNHGPTIVDLTNRYDDTDISVARFESNLGDFEVMLYDSQKPLTVANFWRYADANLWDNSIIHRSVSNFIVQGGGYSNASAFLDIPAFPAVTNEPGISNTRGTIAMAKLGGNPNSATTEWFFNLGDNSANLDNQNGGFTAFGRVLDSGMEVVDDIAAVSRYNVEWLEGAFTDIPLRSYTEGNLPGTNNTVAFSNIGRSSDVTYTVSVGNAALVNATVISGYLNLTYGAGQTGSTTVTVRATSRNSSAFVEDTFNVTINEIADATPTAALVSLNLSDNATNEFNSKLRATFRINNSASVVPTSIGSGDVVLLGPSGYWQPGTLVGLPEQQNNSLLVTFDFPARSGNWDSTDNGNYGLRFLAGTISVVGGGTMAVQNVWSNFLWFNSPTVELVSESVTDGGPSFDVTVRYRDNAGSSIGISWGSIGSGDVTLTQGTESITGSLVTRSVPAAGQLLATYRFAAPDNFWDQADNGGWALRVVASQVFDLQGFLVAPRTLRTYNLFFNTPTPEMTNFTAPNGSAAASITMKYSAAGTNTLSWAGLGDGDLELRGPSGFVGVASLVSRSATQVGGRWQYTVTYSIAAPGGTWNSADNGFYDLWIRPNEVFSSNGIPVPTRSVASGNLSY